MSTIPYIVQKISSLVDRYDTRDPFELCDALDIRIRYKELGNCVKAFYFYQSRIKNIVINIHAGPPARRVLCAHELGHSVLHGELAAMRGFQELELFDYLVPTEYEANLFAAELLIDDETLLELLNDSENSFFGAAKKLCVPAELLDFKFRVLKHKGYRMEAPYIAPSNFLKKELPEDLLEE